MTFPVRGQARSGGDRLRAHPLALTGVSAALLLSGCATEADRGPAASPAAEAADVPDIPCADGTLYFLSTCTPATSIDLDDIVAGGPPPDGIPSIDAPVFEGVEAAGRWLVDDSPVQVVTIDGRTRAYPLAILTWHEIVNDELASVPLAVTFCPLCNSGLVFDRTAVPLEGGEPEVLTFGTSGRLRLSNLLMYDREHANLWQQFSGEAVVGARFLGVTLRRVPSQLIGFGELRRSLPQAQVLSRDTGFDRDYGRNPYIAYDAVDGTPFLYRGPKDARLPMMARVVGLGGGDDAVAVALDHLTSEGVVPVVVAGAPAVVLWAPGQASALDTASIDGGRDVGQTGAFRPVDPDGGGLTFARALDDGRFVDQQTGSTWNVVGVAVAGPLRGSRLPPVAHDDTFWFVWFAFQPDTRLVGA